MPEYVCSPVIPLPLASLNSLDENRKTLVLRTKIFTWLTSETDLPFHAIPIPPDVSYLSHLDIAIFDYLHQELSGLHVPVRQVQTSATIRRNQRTAARMSSD
jgi:hypothetical protein